MEEKRKATAYIEFVFDILYLISVMTMGVYILVAKDGQVSLLYGIMAITLGLGDSFHLVPRIGEIAVGDSRRFRKAKGVGKLVTSVTMTVFYVLLWQIGIEAFNLTGLGKITAIMFALAVLRVLLCFFSQNKWTAENPPVSWGIYRNIPFALMGVAVIVLFYVNMGKLLSLRFVWLAVLLSFAFYIPVVLLSNKYPKVGMLMIPKTLAYVWIVAMGLSL